MYRALAVGLAAVLLDYGADLQLQDENGNPAYLSLPYSRFSDGERETLRALIKAGQDQQ